jgi:hypothetical protein
LDLKLTAQIGSDWSTAVLRPGMSRDGNVSGGAIAEECNLMFYCVTSRKKNTRMK